MESHTLLDFFNRLESQEIPGDSPPILKYKLKGKLVSVSAEEFVVEVKRYVALFQQQLKLEKGELVVSLMANNPNWLIIEFALFLCGAVHAPIRLEEQLEQLEQKLDLLKPRYILLENKMVEKRIAPIQAQQSTAVNIQEEKRSGYAVNMEALPQIKPEDFANVLFTSGSTNERKAIYLSHDTIYRSFFEFSELDFIQDSTNYLSILSHTFSGGRKLVYACLLAGKTICFPNRSKSIKDNVLYFKPDIVASVPAILDELYQDLLLREEQIELKHIVCGGAPIFNDLEKKIHTLGVNVYNVYGLTETASLCAYNTMESHRAGSVGKISKQFDYKINSQGELLLKGPCVAKVGFVNSGYSSLQDAEGFLNTKDIVEVDSDGFLFIRTRNGENVKGWNGEFLNLAKLENDICNVFKLPLCKFSTYQKGFCLNIGVVDNQGSANLIPDLNSLKDFVKLDLRNLVLFSMKTEDKAQKIGLDYINHNKIKEIKLK